MECCKDGSMEDQINKQKEKGEPFADELLLSWIRQTANSFKYLHDKGMIHRDIKTDNILLTNEAKTIKLCDFGFTKKTDDQLTATVLGTVVYMAPE